MSEKTCPTCLAEFREIPGMGSCPACGAELAASDEDELPIVRGKIELPGLSEFLYLVGPPKPRFPPGDPRRPTRTPTR